MMQKKCKSIRDTKHPYWPSWFDLKNYDGFYTLTIQEFVNELEYRLTRHERIHMYSQGSFKEEGWTLITQGQPVIKHNVITRCFPLDTSSVCTIKRVDLDTLAMMKSATDTRRAAVPEPTDYFKNRPRNNESILELTQLQKLELNRLEYQMPYGTSLKRILLSVNLEETTDQQILRDIANILPQLRDKLRTPEQTPNDKKHDNLQTLKKVIEYNAIAWLDLDFYFKTYRHNQTMSLAPSAALLSRVLFHHEKDEYQVKRTVRPWYQKTLLDKALMTRLLSKIRADKWLLSQKVQNL
ncbi:DUF6387 family protein [Photobacterium ganghwense]|uniref:DUF6387 family protein n=1 Tax=Photobacterium ganghwense TaxID=320778 RepID=UPI0040559E6C